MHHYIFSGVAYPERAYVDFGGPVTLEFQAPDAGIRGAVNLTIYKNQVTIDFVSENKVPDLYTLRNVLSDVAYGVLSGACLQAVVGYDIELRSVRAISEETTLVFGIDVPGLSIGDHEKFTDDLMPWLLITGKEPLFRRSISDFKSAIRYPSDTGFFCYRAVESLINIIRNEANIKDKKAAIEQLNQLLNLDSGCIEFLRDLGGDVRHGKLVFITGEIRLKAIKITREILLRFFGYLKERPNLQTKYQTLKP